MAETVSRLGIDIFARFPGERAFYRAGKASTDLMAKATELGVKGFGPLSAKMNEFAETLPKTEKRAVEPLRRTLEAFASGQRRITAPAILQVRQQLLRLNESFGRTIEFVPKAEKQLLRMAEEQRRLAIRTRDAAGAMFMGVKHTELASRALWIGSSAAHAFMLSMSVLRGQVLGAAFSIIFLRFSFARLVLQMAGIMISIGLLVKGFISIVRAAGEARKSMESLVRVARTAGINVQELSERFALATRIAIRWGVPLNQLTKALGTLAREGMLTEEVIRAIAVTSVATGREISRVVSDFVQTARTGRLSLELFTRAERERLERVLEGLRYEERFRRIVALALEKYTSAAEESRRTSEALVGTIRSASRALIIWLARGLDVILKIPILAFLAGFAEGLSDTLTWIMRVITGERDLLKAGTALADIFRTLGKIAAPIVTAALIPLTVVLSVLNRLLSLFSRGVEGAATGLEGFQRPLTWITRILSVVLVPTISLLVFTLLKAWVLWIGKVSLEVLRLVTVLVLQNKTMMTTLRRIIPDYIAALRAFAKGHDLVATKMVLTGLRAQKMAAMFSLTEAVSWRLNMTLHSLSARFPILGRVIQPLFLQKLRLHQSILALSRGYGKLSEDIGKVARTFSIKNIILKISTWLSRLHSDQMGRLALGTKAATVSTTGLTFSQKLNVGVTKMATFWTGAFAKTLVGLKAVVHSVTGAFVALNAVMRAHPVIAIISACTALVSVLIYLQARFQIFTRAWERLKEMGERVGRVFRSLTRTLFDFIRPLRPVLVLLRAIESQGRKMVEVFSASPGLGGSFLDLIDIVSRTVRKLIDIEKRFSLTGKLTVFLERSFKKLRDQILGNLEGTRDLSENLRLVLDLFARLFDPLAGLIIRFSVLREVMRKAGERMKGFELDTSPLKESFEESETTIWDGVKKLIKSLKSAATGLWRSIWKNLGSLTGLWIEAAPSEWIEPFRELADFFPEKGKEVAKAIEGLGKELGKKMGEAGTKVKETIFQIPPFWEPALETLREPFETVPETIKEGVDFLAGEVISRIKTKAQDIAWEILEKPAALKTALKTWTRPFLEGINLIGPGIIEMGTSLAGKVGDVGTAIKEKILSVPPPWETPLKGLAAPFQAAKDWVGPEIVSLGGKLVEKVATGVQDFVKVTLKRVPEAFEEPLKSIKRPFISAIDWIGPGITGLGGNLVEKVAIGVRDFMKETLTAVPRAFEEPLKAIKTPFVEAISWIGPEIVSLGGNLNAKITTGIRDFVKATLETVPEAFVEPLKSIKTPFAEASLWIGPEITSLGGELVGKVATGIRDFMKKSLEEIPEVLKEPLESIKTPFTEAIDWVGPEIVSLGGNLNEKIITGIRDFMKETLVKIPEVLKEPLKSIKVPFTEAVSWIGPEITSLGEMLAEKITAGPGNLVKEALRKIPEVFEEPLKSITTPFVEAITWIGPEITGLGTKMKEKLSEAEEGVKEAISKIPTALADPLDSVKDVFFSAREAIGEQAKGLFEKVKEPLGKMVSKVSEVAEKFPPAFQTLKDAVRNIPQEVGDPVKQAMERVAEGLDLLSGKTSVVLEAIREEISKTPPVFDEFARKLTELEAESRRAWAKIDKQFYESQRNIQDATSGISGSISDTAQKVAESSRKVVEKVEDMVDLSEAAYEKWQRIQEQLKRAEATLGSSSPAYHSPNPRGLLRSPGGDVYVNVNVTGNMIIDDPTAQTLAERVSETLVRDLRSLNVPLPTGRRIW